MTSNLSPWSQAHRCDSNLEWMGSDILGKVEKRWASTARARAYVVWRLAEPTITYGNEYGRGLLLRRATRPERPALPKPRQVG
jgi:hypothetical protein